MNKMYYLLFFILFSCETNIENKPQNKENDFVKDSMTSISKDSLDSDLVKKDSIKNTSISNKSSSINLEKHLLSFGLVDIKSIVPYAIINLKYSTPDNFVGVDMYGDLEKAYSQPDVAQKLKKAYEYLQQEDSNLTLLIFDAVRPVSVQQKMWDTLKLPLREKTKFLSNPKNRSIHNYGAAVDISLSTKSGEELDMGTPFDYIGVLAHPRQEQKLLKEGKLTQKQVDNRIILRKVMKKAGFFNIQTEWWHWNSCSRNKAKSLYKLVE